jgi:hypothetical protein
VFFPPSVKGWDGGRDWINSSTLLFRQNAAFELTRGAGEGARCDPAKLALRYELTDETQLATFFLELFHQRAEPDAVNSIVDVLRREREELSKRPGTRQKTREQLARTAAHLALTMPEYQLG